MPSVVRDTRPPLKRMLRVFSGGRRGVDDRAGREIETNLRRRQTNEAAGIETDGCLAPVHGTDAKLAWRLRAIMKYAAVIEYSDASRNRARQAPGPASRARPTWTVGTMPKKQM